MPVSESPVYLIDDSNNLRLQPQFVEVKPDVDPLGNQKPGKFAYIVPMREAPLGAFLEFVQQHPLVPNERSIGIVGKQLTLEGLLDESRNGIWIVANEKDPNTHRVMAGREQLGLMEVCKRPTVLRESGFNDSVAIANGKSFEYGDRSKILQHFPDAPSFTLQNGVGVLNRAISTWLRFYDIEGKSVAIGLKDETVTVLNKLRV